MNERLFFRKTGDSRYLSHLDLYRCFNRAILRSGIDSWFTEGFHSHLFLSFPLPLSLGMESVCETVDFRPSTLDPVHIELINPFLPKGIELFAAKEPVFSPNRIAWSLYKIELADEILPSKQMRDELENLLNQKNIIFSKKSKKGVMKQLDARPMIRDFCFEEESGICKMEMTVSTGNQKSLNPMAILNLLFERVQREPDHIFVCRNKVFIDSGEEFQ